MTDNPELIFNKYMQAVETLDTEAVLPFYHLPIMLIAQQGVFVALDTNTLRASLSQFMEQLRNQSYRRTEVEGLTVRKLSLDLALFSGTFVRFNTNDEEITRLGFTYTMRNAGSWKIVVAAAYE